MEKDTFAEKISAERTPSIEFKEKLEALMAEYPTITLNIQHNIQIVENK